MRALRGLIAVAIAVGAWFVPGAQAATRRVEVVEIQGIVDGPTERAVTAALRRAEQENAEALIVQIDTAGGIDDARAVRMTRMLTGARVPVVTWIGPPGAVAERSGAVLALAGHVAAMAPGTFIGPVGSLDLRDRRPDPGAARVLLVETLTSHGRSAALAGELLGPQPVGADRAERSRLVDVLALQLPDLLQKLEGRKVGVEGAERVLRTDPSTLSVRFRKLDLMGRLLHAVAKPSIVYLLLLLGLVGVVFELFHPSRGPAGVSGLFAIGLAVYGIVVLQGSWLGVALILIAVASFCVDLRVEGFGLFTALGLAGLVAGSLLLFRAPALRVSSWVLAFGITAMTAFLVGAMTRVLRDLRAIARGELEVTDPHPR